jgi:hypothetical protein
MLSFSYSIISLQHLDFVKHIDKKKPLITFGVGDLESMIFPKIIPYNFLSWTTKYNWTTVDFLPPNLRTPNNICHSYFILVFFLAQTENCNTQNQGLTVISLQLTVPIQTLFKSAKHNNPNPKSLSLPCKYFDFHLFNSAEFYQKKENLVESKPAFCIKR